VDVESAIEREERRRLSSGIRISQEWR